MDRIKVAVSPFYGGENWVDELTNITFETNPRGLNIYSIPTNLDLTNIRKAIRLNSLILVEGDAGEFNEVNEIVVEEPKEEEVKVEEPKEEEVEEVKVEAKEEPKEEAPKRKSTRKRSTAKKSETEKSE